MRGVLKGDRFAVLDGSGSEHVAGGADHSPIHTERKSDAAATVVTVTPGRAPLALQLPTIADRQPAHTRRATTSAERAIAAFNAAQAEGSSLLAAPVRTTRIRVTAEAAAARFVAWITASGLDGEWPVEYVWFLASEDFAPAASVLLPPRRTFFGALQRLAGVSVRYDVRQYSTAGALRGKTTVYSFAVAGSTRAINRAGGSCDAREQRAA